MNGKKRLTIGKQITIGFGVVLALLALASLLSYFGVGGIVNNASQVIEGNKLDGNLAQKEVDHLNWANQVNALLTDENVTELNVETDDHMCGFGKWLFGEGRQRAEELVPSLAPIFKEIEEPHHKLHASAIAIGQHFHQADVTLPGFLAAKEADHLRWVGKVKDLFLHNEPELVVETDDHKCSLGQWLYGEGAKEAAANDPDMAALIEALKEPHRRLHKSAVNIQNVYAQVHPGLILNLKDRLDDHRRWVQKVSVAIIEGRSDLGVQTDPAKCAFGKFLTSEETARLKETFPEFGAAMDAIVEPHNRLHTSAVAIQQALAGAGGKVRAEAVFKNQTLPALNEVAKYIGEAVAAENALVADNQAAEKVYEDETVPALGDTGAALEKIKVEAEHALEGAEKASHIYAEETLPALAETQALLAKIRQEARANIMTDEAMLNSAQGTRRNVTVVGAVAIVVGILLALLIVRGLTVVLKKITDGLESGADQVASASNQVSSSSQQLAEGSAEQAAALEETSSSLEEMASMTKANADNAGQADSLMKEAQQAIIQAGQAMKELEGSMDQIAQSGGEISKIVKSIDEIAFQTNLLALNAAVEAARAGEAGMGFAVVADEVRSLAMRAAEAAKNTQSLVEDTVSRIKQGSEVVTKTQTGFQEVSGSSEKVASLVSEISAASSEQAQGIEQVNQAMGQMDQVVQQSAANAEEGAAAAEELNAQAETMKEIVGELTALVSGSNGHNGAARLEAGPVWAAKPKRLLPPPTIEHEKADSKGNGKQASYIVKPQSQEEIIPLEEDDLSDF